VTASAEPDSRDLDLAGIAHGVGLGKSVYGGMRGRLKRAALASAVAKQRFALILASALPSVPGQTFDIDSSHDMQNARNLVRAVAVDAHHSGFGGGGLHSQNGWHSVK